MGKFNTKIIQIALSVVVSFRNTEEGILGGVEREKRC